MKKIFSFLIFLSSFFFSDHLAFAQKDSIALTELVQKRSKLTQDFPIEKVHLHFDKPYYAVGDTIWFKAYLTMDIHVPSPLSKILYVDLISQKDSVVESLKLPVTQTVATGSIPLPYERIKQGNYRIRAYTKWMLNGGADYLFRKNILIGNAINKELMTNVSFSESSDAKGKTIKALIQYKDERGIPLVNKKVNWEIIADYERYEKGKATTDENGYIRISFPDSRKVSLATGKITTALEKSNDVVYQADFDLKKAITENDLQFFPEGGDLIAGIPTKVAFKALRSDGMGTAVKGEVFDQAGNRQAEIKSQHLGMGFFVLNPQDGLSYEAKVTFENGESKTFPLPAVKSSGMSMAVSQNDENITLRVYANQAFLNANKNKGIYIVGQTNGFIFYAAQTNLNNQVFNAAIPKNKFPSGIIQITLLNASGTPICERLAFIKQQDLLQIKASTDLASYRARQKVKINLSAIHAADTTPGNYSLSVVSDEKVPFDENKEISIFSNLLLTSDLSGYIEQPNYYFNPANDQADEYLDVLMLTQGYRRYSIKDAIDNKAPQIAFYPEQGINITGTIRRSNGFPLEKGRLLLQIPDKHFSLAQTTDNEGRFTFNNLVFKDSSEVIINARNNLNSKDLRIMVDGEAYPNVFPNINAPSDVNNIDSMMASYLKNSKLEHNNALILKEVVIKGAAAKKPSHLDYSSLSGLSMMADRTLQGDMLGGCANIANCLTGAGLTYAEEQLFLTRNYQQGLRVPVEIYVGDMPVDVTYLFSLDAKGIESVEVFNNDGVSGINRRTNTSGVVVFNLKEVKKTMLTKEQFKELFPETNVLKFQPKGYAVERHFYVPKYTGPRTALQAQDVRSTVYWNPVIHTDEQGKASFEFNNNDHTGKYRVVVEGIDNNGRIGRSVSYYEVK